MRYLHDIPNPQFKVGLYSWNNRYILKIEAGIYEQTYKIDQTDVINPDDLPTLLDERFTEQVAQRFTEMAHNWAETIERNEP
ncbi:MAG: hypothetical protein EAZ91_13575 [Cytophagales bacterium]|nr:MAG: hypothetical protein EAZ91_13575 [Cytophagales bacterium]